MTQSAAPFFSPTGVDYGHDLSCITDLDPAMLEIDGRLVLAQALARRLITPRGGLIDDPNYGYDLRLFLNDDQTAAAVAMIGSGIDAEFLKDERVLASTTTVTFTTRGVLTTVSSITDNIGPFSLVLGVGGLTVANGIVILKVGS